MGPTYLSVKQGNEDKYYLLITFIYGLNLNPPNPNNLSFSSLMPQSFICMKFHIPKTK